MIDKILKELSINVATIDNGKLVHANKSEMISILGSVSFNDDDLLSLDFSKLKDLTDTQKASIRAIQNEAITTRRKIAYRECDDLFFEAMRGDGDLSKWRAALDAIDERLPLLKEHKVSEVKS